MMVSFVLSFFPRDVLDEILNLIESVSEDFPSYSLIPYFMYCTLILYSCTVCYIYCLFVFVDQGTLLTSKVLPHGYRSAKLLPTFKKLEGDIMPLLIHNMWPFLNFFPT